MKVLILTEKELRAFCKLDLKLAGYIETAFAKLSSGQTRTPAIMHLEVPDKNGDVDIKSAYILGENDLAVKIGAGFFENAKRGLPSATASVVVVNSATGFTDAVLLDNGYLTDIRTGAAGAVVARHLAPADVETAGVIGAGAQGRYQMMGLKLVRDFKKLYVFDLDEARLNRYVAEMSEKLGVEVIAAKNARQVIEKAEVVVTTTPSRKAYIDADWIRPGQHITTMGADLPEKQEIDPRIWTKADIRVCDVKSQCVRLGELHHAVVDGILPDTDSILEIGDIVSGKAAGRTTGSQISICDLTGSGVQDAAVSSMAVALAKEQNYGMWVNNPLC